MNYIEEVQDAVSGRNEEEEFDEYLLTEDLETPEEKDNSHFSWMKRK